jgi:hypothetical protein
MRVSPWVRVFLIPPAHSKPSEEIKMINTFAGEKPLDGDKFQETVGYVF